MINSNVTVSRLLSPELCHLRIKVIRRAGIHIAHLGTMDSSKANSQILEFSISKNHGYL